MTMKTDERTIPAVDDARATVRAYFERGFIAAAAWAMTKCEGEKLSDTVIDHAWAHRDEGMDAEDMLPVPAATPVTPPPMQTDVARLVREALEPFARLADGWTSESDDDGDLYGCSSRFPQANVRVGWLRAAAAALAAMEREGMVMVSAAELAELRQRMPWAGGQSPLTCSTAGSSRSMIAAADREQGRAGA